MGLKFEDLIEGVRQFMIEEIDMDANSEKIHLSAWLTQGGQGNWADTLRDAARSGNDDALAAEIRVASMLVHKIQRRKPTGGYVWADLPENAPQILAESEFNRYFCRGLSRHAINASIARLQVYRAKAVMQPRPESERKIGLLVDPRTILIDLRSCIGVEPALGIPPLAPGAVSPLGFPKTRRRAHRFPPAVGEVRQIGQPIAEITDQASRKRAAHEVNQPTREELTALRDFQILC